MLGQLLVGNYLYDTALCWIPWLHRVKIIVVVGCCIRGPLDLKVDVLQVLLQVLLLADLLNAKLLLSGHLHALLRLRRASHLRRVSLLLDSLISRADTASHLLRHDGLHALLLWGHYRLSKLLLLLQLVRFNRRTQYFSLGLRESAIYDIIRRGRFLAECPCLLVYSFPEALHVLLCCGACDIWNWDQTFLLVCGHLLVLSRNHQILWRPIAELLFIHHAQVVISCLANLNKHGSLLFLVICLQWKLLVLELLSSWVAATSIAEHRRMILLISITFCV